MKLTAHSKNHLYGSFVHYSVDKEFADPIYNYLVYGFNPGGFFYALLANDFMTAISRSHPMNKVEALKRLVVWIINVIPKDVCWGSYEAVDNWLKMSAEDRRTILEQHLLVYSERDEIMMILKNEPTVEPLFF
jgi:hypothetical protein